MKATSYLVFNGNAEQAANHYAKILGGRIENLHYYGESIPNIPEEHKGKVMHLCLLFCDQTIGMADAAPDAPTTFGSGNIITLDCDSEEQIKAIYEGLSSGAKITCPLQTTFFAKFYAELVDCFGVSWALMIE